MEIRTMPDGRRIDSDSAILGYYTASEFYPTLAENVDLSRLPYSVIEDGIEWRSASPLRVRAPHPPENVIGEFVFFPLWDQINVPHPFVWRGKSPTDAILRHWATCLPDTVLSSPLRCVNDGHAYHLELTARGREIHVIAEPVQFQVVTLPCACGWTHHSHDCPHADADRHPSPSALVRMSTVALSDYFERLRILRRDEEDLWGPFHTRHDVVEAILTDRRRNPAGPTA